MLANGANRVVAVALDRMLVVALAVLAAMR